MPVFSVQTATMPEETVEPVEHGLGNSRIKTAGQYIAGDATLERIIPATDNADSRLVNRFFRDWQRLAQNPISGGGKDPLQYKWGVLVEELANDGITVLNSYYLNGAWPTKINGRAYSRTESNNVVESVDLSTDVVPYV